MTTITCGLICNDSINLEAFKKTYEKRAHVSSVWVDVSADLQRPAMRRQGYDRAAWFAGVLPACLRALQGRPGDLDLFVTVEDDDEAAAVLAVGGLLVRLSEDGGESADGALDLRGLPPKAAAQRLAQAVG